MRRKTDPSFYDTDLAFVHDQGFGRFAQHAAQAIWHLIESKPEKMLILDLGCGSGILARELVEKGVSIVGVDCSSAMIELARRNAPQATFLTASMYDFDIPSCNLVCSIGECVNYLFDSEVDLPKLEELFVRIYRALKPAGYFVFDTLTLDLLDTVYTRSRTIEEDSWTLFLDIEVSKEECLLTRKITLFLETDGCYRKSKETHKQRLYDQGEIENILTHIGFDITQINGYGGMPFRAGQIGFICQKHEQADE